MMLEWSDKGKRFRVSAKTRSWSEAEQRARARMADTHARTIGDHPKAEEPVSLERAVGMFITKKSGKHKETRRKYQYALDRLKAWAVRHGRHYLADITESDLEKYQASWALKKNYAKRNEQERLRTFFRYCCASAEIKLPYSPTAQLEHFNVTSDEPEDPYTAKEYTAIVAACDKVPSFTGEVAERVKVLIAVMRYAGLAIQDAAILERGPVTPAKVNLLSGHYPQKQDPHRRQQCSAERGRGRASQGWKRQPQVHFLERQRRAGEHSETLARSPRRFSTPRESAERTLTAFARLSVLTS
jgi:hypothetical protein